MSEIRAMTDVRELDPVELAGVVGGFLVGGDDYCGTFVPRVPLPTPILSVFTSPVVDVIGVGSPTFHPPHLS